MEAFRSAVDALVSNLEKIGLHAEHSMLRGGLIEEIEVEDPDALELSELLKDGKAYVGVEISFVVGDLAWSNHVLEPEKFAEQANGLLTPGVQADIVREFYRGELASGRSLLDIDPSDLLGDSDG